jgi:hypothetical protein
MSWQTKSQARRSTPPTANAATDRAEVSDSRPDAQTLSHSGHGVAFDFSRMPVLSGVRALLQPKLTVNAPGDAYEQEADRISEQVMHMPQPKLQRACACGGGCPGCQTEEPGEERRRLQTKHVGSGDPGQAEAPPIVHEVLRSPGQPLDPETRAFMEPRFGHDFSQVRVHTDRDAARSSRLVNAVAYTVGSDIVFGHGQYAPHTESGRRLIAHELSHIVQQHAMGSTTISPGFVLQRQVIDPRALQTETISTPRHLRISEWLIEPVAGGGSSQTEMYWVDFEVDAKGVMRASVRTVAPDRAYRSAKLRFGEQFRAALQHFDANGVEVNAFEGDWSYMTKDEISENLKVFREGMAAGKTREKAAGATPSGRVATRSGFELTSVENVPESQEHLAEEGVRRWRVKALFHRVPAPSKPGPVKLPQGETTTELPTLPTIRGGRGRLATVEPEEAEEFGGGGGGSLSGLGEIVVEVIGPMLQAFAWALVPALSNKLWEQDKKKLEAEILQRLNSPDSLRRLADEQLDQPGLTQYGNITVEIVTEDAFQALPSASDIPVLNETSYYASSRLIDVQISNKDIKRTTEHLSSRNMPGQSTTVHTVTETYSVAIPQLENRLIRARLQEIIAELDREMARSFSQADNFSLRLMRDELAMRLSLYQSD